VTSTSLVQTWSSCTCQRRVQNWHRACGSRRFRTGSQSCSPISTNNESEAIAALETCVANHAGEYVRLFGIDPKAKAAGVGNDYPATRWQFPAQAATSSQSRILVLPSPSSNFVPGVRVLNSSETVEQLRQLLSKGTRLARSMWISAGSVPVPGKVVARFQQISRSDRGIGDPVANQVACACLALTQGEAVVLKRLSSDQMAIPAYHH